jgi:hypothetical protein
MKFSSTFFLSFLALVNATPTPEPEEAQLSHLDTRQTLGSSCYVSGRGDLNVRLSHPREVLHCSSDISGSWHMQIQHTW